MPGRPSRAARWASTSAPEVPSPTTRQVAAGPPPRSPGSTTTTTRTWPASSGPEHEPAAAAGRATAPRETTRAPSITSTTTADRRRGRLTRHLGTSLSALAHSGPSERSGSPTADGDPAGGPSPTSRSPTTGRWWSILRRGHSGSWPPIGDHPRLRVSAGVRPASPAAAGCVLPPPDHMARQASTTGVPLLTHKNLTQVSSE